MITVSPITAAELESLQALYMELVPDRPVDLDLVRAGYARIAGHPDYALLGARNEQGELLGSVLAIVCHDLIGECQTWMIVENVIVTQRARGLGIGKVLMDAAEEIAHLRGCSYISLTSAVDRLPAHQFYEGIGYRRDEVFAFRKALQPVQT